MSFKTKAEAQAVADQARIKRRNEGLSAFSFSQADRVDAENALAVLRRHGISLKSAADFAALHSKAVTTDTSVTDLVEDLLSKKKQDGKSSYHLSFIRSLWRRFASAHTGMKASDITRTMADRWLRAVPGISGRTRNEYQNHLKSLFAYAISQGYAVDNPFLGLERAKEDRGIPAILTIAELIALLKAADPKIMPALLLGAFAGLRPYSEGCRLRWEHIDFESRQIDIAPGNTKNKASIRYVTMSDNLVQWLLLYRQPSGLIVKSVHHYNKLRKKAVKAAGIKSWVQDGLRHTFASMHYAYFDGKDEKTSTSKQMGHIGNDMLARHYRARVTATEAEAYWNIRPTVVRDESIKPDMLLPEVMEEFIASGECANSRSIIFTVRKFCRENPLLQVAKVSFKDVDRWVDQEGRNFATQRSYRYQLSNLFQFALARGYCIVDPTGEGTGPRFAIKMDETSNIIPMLAAAV